MAREEFKRSEVEELLVACRRHCCVCHKRCGVKIEVDHIESATTSGSGKIENAIPLCFDCHAEVHHYDPKNPKGRKFQPSELRMHRDQWLKMCCERPEIFLQATFPTEAGSLERLLNELEFNRVVALRGQNAGSEGSLEVAQFRRAIADGTFSWLASPQKDLLLEAYAAIQVANTAIDGMLHSAPGLRASAGNTARALLGKAACAMTPAIDAIQAAGSDDTGT